MLRFDKWTYLPFLFKFILFKRLSYSLRRSYVLLYSEFINIVSILFYKFIEFITLLYTFLVISFARYKEYIFHLILFSKYSDILHVFTCARAIGNLWSICLGLNILRFEWSETLTRWAMHVNILEILCLWVALYLVSDTIKEWSLNNLIRASWKRKAILIFLMPFFVHLIYFFCLIFCSGFIEIYSAVFSLLLALFHQFVFF